MTRDLVALSHIAHSLLFLTWNPPFFCPQPEFGGVLLGDYSVPLLCKEVQLRHTASACRWQGGWKPQMTHCRINRPLSLPREGDPKLICSIVISTYLPDISSINNFVIVCII